MNATTRPACGRGFRKWGARVQIHQVALSSEAGQPTLKEKAEAEARERLTGVRADPLVRAVLERFPGAQIVDVRDVAPTVGVAAAVPEVEVDADGDVLPPVDLEGFDEEF